MVAPTATKSREWSSTIFLFFDKRNGGLGDGSTYGPPGSGATTTTNSEY